MGERTAPQGGTQAVDRAASLIDLVVRAEEPLTYTELVEETGLARSTASRLLAALERTQLVERDVNGAYDAGPLFALYAAQHNPWPQVARLAMPALEELRDRTGETVHLGVPHGGSVLHIAQIDSVYLLGSRDWTQVEVPTHCSSLGKVLYAYDCLPLPTGKLERRTPLTVDSREALLQELAGIRRNGYATAIDELEVGLTALASPVEGREGVIAAVGISGPTARLQDRVDQVGRLLIEQGDRLSGLLRRRRDKEGAA